MKTNWPVKKLGEVCVVVTDGVHKTPKYTETGVRFISIKNIAPFEKIKWNDYVRYISSKDHEEFSKKAKVERGDILFPRIGTLGFAKKVDFDEPVSIFVGLGLAKPKHELIDSSFLEYWMNSPFVYKYSHEKATGAGRLTLSLDASRNMPIPLPSIEEQRRIVKKLEKILSKIGEAKNLQTEVQKELGDLTNSLLDKAFKGEL